MKQNFKRIVAAAAAVLLLSLFSACDTGLPWDIELWGTWNAGDTTVTVTNSAISIDNPDAWNWDYSGEIVKFDNFNYNIPSENPADGNYGYLVFKITSHDGDATQVGTYSVIRWRALKTENGVTTAEYSEAYPAGFASLEEAIAGADADHFSYFSAMTAE